MSKLNLLGSLALSFVLVRGLEAIATAAEPQIAKSEPLVQTQVGTIKDLPKASTSVVDWMAQIKAATVPVTGVKLVRTATGLDIVLETAENKALPVVASQFRAEGNRLIADIPNAVLTLPEEPTFTAENPTNEIATVQVLPQEAGGIRVVVTGTNTLPTQEITLKAGAFSYSLNPTTDEPDEEVVVTGAGQGSYRVPDTSVGTRTDTPLRDIPQSVQVVPQQVIRDTQARSITEALENVPGVAAQGSGSTGSRDYFTIRGFEAYNNSLVNGLPDPQITSDAMFFNVEQLEVLKGPASVLYGDTGFSGIGGTINYVTKKPLAKPFYEINTTVGNYGFVQGSLDLSGPLNSNRTALYRLISGFRYNDSITDFNSAGTLAIAPSLSLKLGEKTSLLVEGDVTRLDRNGQQPGPQPVLGTLLPNPNGKISRSFNPTGPVPNNITYNGRIGYYFEHQFSDNLKLRNTFRYTFYRDDDSNIDFSPSGLEGDNRTLNRTGTIGEQYYNYYLLDTNLLSKFKTGTIEHQLLAGFSLSRNTTDLSYEFGIPAAPVDIFNRLYDQTLVAGDRNFSSFTTRDTLGLYLQNQVTLLQNLKFLLGGRFDFFSERSTNRLSNTESKQSDIAFSPRVGIVYQPIKPISLYASYSRSFAPTIGTSASEEIFQPERGTQYEIGVKADLSERLSATLAFYDLTRSNVTTTDPINPNFSVQTGKQRSRGLEFNVAGEILPGWDVIAGYAYMNARVTEDNSTPIGNRLFNSPNHSFNIWSTYRIQRGSLRGLGVGLGLYYIGERPLDNANTIDLPSFLRTDAAVFYERDQLRIAINFRNIFDVENYVSSYGSSDFVQIGTPFTVQGTLSWRF
ncbi:MAG: TonB-dependent siderophore receptor [Thermosynechococcaceae cyanobacterium MS004]|nr:TonB-dependent siderophore receptor [Thermosynechococcaceae cyanobacterium MS004]